MHRAGGNKLRRLALHAPGQGGLAAERFLVEEIAPAADALANQETERCHIEHGADFHLADLRGDGAGEQSGNHAAVNAEGRPDEC